MDKPDHSARSIISPEKMYARLKKECKYFGAHTPHHSISNGQNERNKNTRILKIVKFIAIIIIRGYYGCLMYFFLIPSQSQYRRYMDIVPSVIGPNGEKNHYHDMVLPFISTL